MGCQWITRGGDVSAFRRGRGLNGDGKLDLVTADYFGGVTILLNITPRASSPAAEVDRGLRVRRRGGAAMITWNFPACAATSDVLRGLVSGLPVGPVGGDETCLANGLPPTTLTWTGGANPGTGAAFCIWSVGTAQGATGRTARLPGGERGPHDGGSEHDLPLSRGNGRPSHSCPGHCVRSELCAR